MSRSSPPTRMSALCAQQNIQAVAADRDPIAGAPQERHFIVHMRRAGRVVTRPLNCNVSCTHETRTRNDRSR